MEEFQLEPGEKVTRTARVHWFVLLVSFIPFVILAVLPLLVPVIFGKLAALNPASIDLSAGFSADNRWYRLFLGF